MREVTGFAEARPGAESVTLRHLASNTVDGEVPAREHAGTGYEVPNGGVYSTVADLGRFLGALAGVPGLRTTGASRRSWSEELRTTSR